MTTNQIISAGIVIDTNEQSYINLSSEKGSGQVINRGTLGFEMNCTVDSQGDVQFYPTKSAAKAELVSRLRTK